MKKIKNILMIVILAVIVISPQLVSAQLDVDSTYGIGTHNPGAGGDETEVAGIIGTIITFLLGFVGALSVLIIIIGGIFYIISGGETSKTDTAKGYILYAVVGLIVSLLGWVIVNTVVKQL